MLSNGGLASAAAYPFVGLTSTQPLPSIDTDACNTVLEDDVGRGVGGRRGQMMGRSGGGEGYGPGYGRLLGRPGEGTSNGRTPCDAVLEGDVGYACLAAETPAVYMTRQCRGIMRLNGLIHAFCRREPLYVVIPSHCIVLFVSHCHRVLHCRSPWSSRRTALCPQTAPQPCSPHLLTRCGQKRGPWDVPMYVQLSVRCPSA